MLNIILYWICWLFWAGLPPLTAYPVSSSIKTDLSHIYTSSKWEQYWIQYTLGLLSVTVTALTLAGCVCCRRSRRPKGFQGKAEKFNQEFKDGNNVGQDSVFEHSVDGLELDVPRMLAVADRVQFEPLPVEHIISGSKNSSKSKPLPLSTSFFEKHDSHSSTFPEHCHEWFNTQELHVSREKLKYLREIGHGWFGKVVEGRADLEGHKRTSKNGSVVVRILTEEATTKEKAWFLGEATPYLKLHHQNVLNLLGFCLETDPYLLLFESCPAGDLKGFLLSNRDKKSQEALIKENIPIRLALDIVSGLKHMHYHGFVHTDLSARNCLVASDLSAKLGDYGTGVEKYPEDYYVVGDRALPIRWSAPESIECTDTTIETREITCQANMWSYAIFLWEIVTWGKRPYHNKSDEQVIQMLLSLRTDLLSNGIRVLQTYLENCPPNIYQTIHLCLNLNPQKRPNLDEVKQFLVNEHSEYFDFEQRWESLRINTTKHVRSASLQDLRGSIDSDYWTTIVDDTPRQSSFRLGPGELLKNIPNVKNVVQHESSSETEEESWKGRIEQGIYSEKVKQKSKSVTDLMILVHIDFDSDAELSMGNQISEKCGKKKLSATGSETDLRHSTYTDEFDEALRKLRNPFLNNISNKTKTSDNLEKPKLLTLTMDQAQTPILRLSLDNKESITNIETTPAATINTETCNDKHVLRLVSKGEPNFPLLCYVPDNMSSEELKESNESQYNDVSTHENNNNSNTCFSDNFSTNFETNESNLVDVILWNHALDSALEKKIPGFLNEGEFKEYAESSSKKQDNISELTADISIPDIPQLTKCSTCNVNDEFCSGEDMDIQRKCVPSEDEEERKQLSTPDDEQSSDSGFRDKESCEEEENVCPSIPSTSADSVANALACTEDEQLQILFELDTILDAEYYSTLNGSEKSTENLSSIYHVDSKVVHINKDKLERQNESSNIDLEEMIENKERTELIKSNDFNSVFEQIHSNVPIKINYSNQELKQCLHSECEAENEKENDTGCGNKSEGKNEKGNENIKENILENELEDEGSSTMSLNSDNSYVSFDIEEEFVTAIRNELREKLPCAQMSVVEPLESRDDDNSMSNDIENKWDDDNEDSSNQGSGGVGISIRYNVYGTPLSPIQEERESTLTSESLMSNSRDVSIASKESIGSDDILLVDTQTNKMILFEELEGKLQDDERDTTTEDLSEEENLDYNCSIIRSRNDKLHMITSGGAPLPSPEEESKWQQLPSSFPLPLPSPLEDNLMSTSFGTEHEWGSQDEDEEENEVEEGEDNSSSSGEFVWKRYNEPHIEQLQIQNSLSNNEERVTNDIEDKVNEKEEKVRAGVEVDGEEEEEEEEEEEFTPSAWNATLAPHRSALRSPDKTLKSNDQKKSVWFKKQRYHCVYEYPKETSVIETQGETITTWEPTSYSDWEEMIDEPRLDMYPLDYDDVNQTGSDEFFVSSSNRPFQFQASDSKYVSQFFPGASTSVNEEQDEIDGNLLEIQQNKVELLNDCNYGQQHQLGELRHTRNRLKLNLSTNGTSFISVKQIKDNTEQTDDKEKASDLLQSIAHDQHILSNTLNHNSLPMVPPDCQQEKDLNQISAKNAQCDSQEKSEPTSTVF